MSQSVNSEFVHILMADDDLEDCELMREAMAEYRMANNIEFVHDGEQLLSRLRDPQGKHRPDIVLLDLNMPRMNGLEALKHIRADPSLRSIPVIILTTSKAEEDVARTYAEGGNSYITKPVSFDGLVEIVAKVTEYWFAIVRLPQ